MTYQPSRFLRRSSVAVCAVVWLAAATATHVPAETFSEVPVGDVVLHFTGYFGLTYVFLLTLRVHGVGFLHRVLLAAGVLLLYGALDEITQPWVNRCASIYDWFANAVGISAAVSLDALGSLVQWCWENAKNASKTMKSSPNT